MLSYFCFIQLFPTLQGTDQESAIAVRISIFIYKQLGLPSNIVFINKADFNTSCLHVVESLVLVV